MSDSKTPGRIIKGRRVALFCLNSNPQTWMIFDEPENHKSDEHDATCKAYHLNHSRIQAYVIYARIIQAYRRSKKDIHTHAINLRNRK